jgi:hypothetical protein
MDGKRFDMVGKWLATKDSRRSTLRGLTAGALAIGLGRLNLEEAVAKCKQDGQKCKKDNECCSKKCKGKKCRCRTVRETCTGTVGSAGNTCCDTLLCGTNACGDDKRCCKGVGSTCGSDCDCCLDGAECQGGECCLGEGALCAFLGSEACCAGLFCDIKSGLTCQPV